MQVNNRLKIFINTIRQCAIIALFLAMVLRTNGMHKSEGDTMGVGKTIDDLRRKSLSYRYTNFDTAIALVDSALSVLNHFTDSSRYVLVIATKGIICFNNGRNELAANFFKTAYDIARRNRFHKSMVQCLNLISLSEINRGNFDLALKYQLEFKAFVTDWGDSEALCNSNNNLGLIYYKLNDFRESLVYYKQALLYPSVEGKEDIYLNLGLCFTNLKDYDSAALYFEKGTDSCAPGCSNYVMMHYFYGLGHLQFSKGDFESAYNHFVRSSAYAKERNDELLGIESMISVAECLIEQRQLKNSEAILRESLQKLEGNSSNLHVMRVYSNLAKVALASSEFPELCEYFEKYIAVSNIVYNEDLRNKISVIQFRFNERENINKIDKQKEALKLYQDKIKERKTAFVLIGIGTALLIIVSIALLQISKIARAVNGRLESYVHIETANLEDSLLSAVRERNSWNKSTLEAIKEIKRQLASVKGYDSVSMNADGNKVLEAVFSDALRSLEENLTGFQESRLG